MTANALQVLEDNELIKVAPLNDNFDYLNNKISTSASNMTAYVQSQVATAQSNILSTIYPVGSIYIGTTENCPLASVFGTWEKVSEGRVLQGSDDSHAANTTIAAGLPNITGNILNNPIFIYSQNDSNGVFRTINYGIAGTGSGASMQSKSIYFDASYSNSIYGNSSTVQPSAYVVNVWRRTA